MLDYINKVRAFANQFVCLYVFVRDGRTLIIITLHAKVAKKVGSKDGLTPLWRWRGREDARVKLSSSVSELGAAKAQQTFVEYMV